jgi:uncharacterized membrane protein YoaK (UPF0700 family)
MSNPSGSVAPADDGGLMALLLVMTVVTGMVDAVSILTLGHVFVANMTGNVVFLGFALAGSRDFSKAASLLALASFLFGAAVSGRLGRRSSPIQALTKTLATQAAVVSIAVAATVAFSGSTERYVVTTLLAMAMGAQNASVRRLAVPDMTTTVLTLTLTGLAADPPSQHGPARSARRLAAVGSMLAGAVLGGVLVLHTSATTTLASTALLLVAICAVASVRERDGGRFTPRG